MTFPDDRGVDGKAEEAFDCFTGGHTLECGNFILCMNIPDLDVAPAIDPGPDTEDILAASDAEHSPTHLLACFGKLIANNGQKKVFPITISNTLLQPNDPLSTSLILLIFPYRSDAFLEYVVVRDRGQCGRPLQM